MNNRNIVPLSYALSIAFFCLGIYAQITHSGDLMTMLIGCGVTQILFAILTIYELRKSEQLTQKEKSNWTALLIISPIIFGIMYLKTIRRKVLYY